MSWSIDRLLKAAAEKTLAGEKVPPEVKEFRLGICEANDCNGYAVVRGEKRCLYCGCYLDVKAGCATNVNPKTMKWEVTHCPKGLWDDKEILDFYQSP